MVNSCTIANNHALNSGGGIFNYLQGSTTIGNSIVAQNTLQNGGAGADVAGNITSADYNLFGSAPAGSVAGATSHNITSADVRLGELANNGGPTATIALLAGSPAYEAGDNAVADLLATDQRGAGYARKFGEQVDIGAYESQQALNVPPVASDGSFMTNEDTAVSGTLVASDDEGAPLVYTIISGPAAGTLTAFNATTGEFTYMPATNYSGADSFTFKVNDGQEDSNVATVSISITAVNDAPTISTANQSPITRQQGTAATNAPIATVSDVGKFLRQSDRDSDLRSHGNHGDEYRQHQWHDHRGREGGMHRFYGR